MATASTPNKPVANWEQLRDEWVARLADLVDQVEAWGREFGWETRRLDKRMDDPQIGTYAAPGLLLQADFARLLLDPIARFVPGGEGVVDLYVMPAYDDIASLYYTDRGWQLHYRYPGRPGFDDDSDQTGRPLTREALAEVVEEMRRHATANA